MIYAGQDQASLEPLEVSRLVEEMLELLRVSISKHAVLKTDLGKDLPAVRANASQIRQVVMNLVINASEAIGEKDGAIVHIACNHTSSQPPGISRTCDRAITCGWRSRTPAVGCRNNQRPGSSILSSRPSSRAAVWGWLSFRELCGRTAAQLIW
jgi:hypothetical protein